MSIAAAATDAVVFRSALAITEAHIIAARDAHALGETEAAAEMFAHPVSEVLFDMEPIFQARGVKLFDEMLTEASRAVLAGETPEQIGARTAAIIAVLRDASTFAPNDGRTDAAIAAGVAADQIERAVDMYRAAAGSEMYEPYLDGYGFYLAGKAAYDEAQSEIAEADPDAAAAIEAALLQLAEAYQTALRPGVLDADRSALTVAASNVVLKVTND